MAGPEHQAEGALVEAEHAPPNAGDNVAARSKRTFEEDRWTKRVSFAQDKLAKAADSAKASEAAAAEQIWKLAGEITARATALTFMRRKRKSILDFFAFFDSTKTKLHTWNTFEVEGTLLRLFESISKLEEATNGLFGFLVAFSVLDIERANINDTLLLLSLHLVEHLNGTWSNHGLQRRLDAEDALDALEDSQVYRQHLAELVQKAEIASEQGEQGNENASQETDRRLGRHAESLLAALKESDQDISRGQLFSTADLDDDAPKLGVLDLGRHNIYRVFSITKLITTEANAALDALESIAPPLLEQSLVSDVSRVQIDGREFFQENWSKRDVLVYRPYSKRNRPELPSSFRLDQLQFQARVEIRQELRRWRALEHSNVLRVFGASFVGNSIAVVLEPCDMSLSSVLYKEGRDIKQKEVETIVRGVARGLAFLHENNIVHRQVCPQNVLVSHDLGVKLSGFGCAWVESDARSDIQSMYPYLAPEALHGDAMCTAGADIYSFAMVAWEVSHRRRPFHGKSYGEVLKVVSESSERPPFDSTSAVPEAWFEDLVTACWDRNIVHRPTASMALAVIVKNTKSTVRTSQRVMQGLLSFIPARKQLSPRSFLHTLEKTDNDAAALAALDALYTQMVKEIRPKSKKGKDTTGAEWYFDRLWNLGGPKRVLDAMVRFKAHPGVQATGCRLVRVMGQSAFEPSFSQRQLELVVSFGAGEAVVDAVRQHGANAEIAESACGALKSLSSAGEDYSGTAQRRQKLLDLKAHKALLETMEAHPDNATIQANACAALKHLGFLQVSLREPDVVESIPVIIAAVKRCGSDIEVARHGTGALMNLSFDGSVQSRIIDEGGVDVLFWAISTFADLPDVSSAVFLAFWNLCFCDESVATKLLELGIDDTLRHAAAKLRTEPIVVGNALSLIDSLAWLEPNRRRLQVSGFAALVFGLLQQWPDSEEIWESGVAALKSLAWGDKGRTIDSAGLEWLFGRVVGKFVRNTEIVRHAVLFLQNLTCEEDNLDSIFQIGGATWVMRVMTSHPGEEVVQEAGCGALCNLATPSGYKRSIYKAGASTWIQRAMRNHPTNLTIQKNGSTALIRLAQCEANHKEMTEPSDAIVAGLVKAATMRFPELLGLPDLVDVSDIFPISEAALENCTICLEPLCFEDVGYPFRCQHSFHTKCATKWSKVQNTCPLCRAEPSDDFVPSDDASDIDPHLEEDDIFLQPFLDALQNEQDEDELDRSPANSLPPNAVDAVLSRLFGAGGRAGPSGNRSATMTDNAASLRVALAELHSLTDNDDEEDDESGVVLSSSLTVSSSSQDSALQDEAD